MSDSGVMVKHLEVLEIEAISKARINDKELDQRGVLLTNQSMLPAQLTCFSHSLSQSDHEMDID